MNKTIYETEFTKMVHDKMREANKFKESQWGESDPLDMDENLVHEKTTFGKSDTISA